MAESLEDVKDRVRRSFLGKDGIHGIGISRSQQAIRVVYVTQGQASRARSRLTILESQPHRSRSS